MTLDHAQPTTYERKVVTPAQAKANRRRVAAQAAKAKVSLSVRLNRKVDPRVRELAKDARF